MASRLSAPERRRRSAGDDEERGERRRRPSAAALRRLSMRAFSKTFMNKKRVAREAKEARSAAGEPAVRDQFAELQAVQEAVRYYPKPLGNDVDLIRYKGRDPAMRDRTLRGESIAVEKDLVFEPRVVHMFVSSTFRDMRFERDCIVGLLVPRIRQYCRIHGLQFQCQDMRWAVTDRAHDSRDLSLEELHRCKTRSFAFNFVGLIGNRYGFCPFPTRINASVFEKLVDEAENPDLLTTWFALDENRQPARYTLRRVEDVYGTSAGAFRMAAVDAVWWATFRKLQTELRDAARRLEIEGFLSEEAGKDFERSVVEEEVTFGVLEQSDHHKTHLVIRELVGEGVEEDTTFYETEELDAEGYARTSLEALKQTCIDRIHKDHCRVYELPYEGGLDPIAHEAHSEYLRSMLSSLEEKIIASIKHTLMNGIFLRDPVFETVRAHAARIAFCAKTFVGRAELLRSIRSSRKRLIFVSGGAGTGKTFALSKICADVAEGVAKRGRDNVVVARILGTSHDSTASANLLRLLYEQLCGVYCTAGGRPPMEIPVRPRDVRDAFLDFLALATEDQPLMLVLDGIDQLRDGDFSWVPLSASALPPHVRLVVSARSGTKPARVFHRAAQEDGAATWVTMPAFAPDEAEAFLDAWLEAEDRVLQPRQKASVLQTVASLRDPSPLALRALYEQARKLTSSSPPLEQYEGARTIDDILSVWFAGLEADHGQPFVQAALALITASHTGLEETELEDLLSLRDDLLAEAYTNFVPPLARFPQRKICQLLADLRPFMWRGNWAHRELARAALARYDGKMLAAYRAIADYFGADSPSALERPVFKTEVSGEQWVVAQNRFPQGQPFRFETGAVNLRKFHELPGALRAVGDVDALEALVCHLDFIRVGLETSTADLLYWLQEPASFRCTRVAQAVRQSLVAYKSSPEHLEEILWLRLAPRLEPGDPLLDELDAARMRTPGLHALAPLRDLQNPQISRSALMDGSESLVPDSSVSQASSRKQQQQQQKKKKKRVPKLRSRHASRAGSRKGSRAGSRAESRAGSRFESSTGPAPSSAADEVNGSSQGGAGDSEFEADEVYTPANLFTLHGHTEPVTSLDTYEDPVTKEVHLVSVSEDSLRVWNAESRLLQHTITLPASEEAGARQVVAYVEPGGGARVVTQLDRDLVVYTLPSCNEVRRIPDAHAGSIDGICLLYQSNGDVDLVSCGSDGTIAVWSGLTGRRRKLIETDAAAGALVDLELFLDPLSGNWQALGVHAHEAIVYDLGTGMRAEGNLAIDAAENTEASTFRESVTYFHDGSLYALTCSEETGTLRVWDVKEGVTVNFLEHDEHFNSPFTCMDIFEDAATNDLRCVTGDIDGVVKIWDVVAGKLLHIAEIHDGPVADVAAFIDEEKEVWIGSSSADGRVVLSNRLPEVEANSSSASTQTLDSLGHAQALASYTDGNRGWQVISVHGSWVVVMDPKTLALNLRWNAEAAVRCIAVDDVPRSRHARCVVGLETGLVSVWAIPSTKVLSVQAHKGQTLSVCVFDPRTMDDNLVASSGEDGVVAVHNVMTGSPICRWRAHDAAIHSVHAFYNEHTAKLLSCDLDGHVRVWDFDKTRKASALMIARKKAAPELEVENSSRVVALFAYTEARTRQPSIVLANHGPHVRVIGLDGSERVLRGHARRILFVSSFANPATGMQCIVSAGKDQAVRVWDTRGTLLSTYVFDQHIKALSTHRIPSDAFIMVSLKDGQLVVLRYVPRPEELSAGPQ